MMAKTRAEIEKLFTPHLQEGEAFRWFGEPESNLPIESLFQFLDEAGMVLINLIWLCSPVLFVFVAFTFIAMGGIFIAFGLACLLLTGILAYEYMKRKSSFEVPINHDSELIFYAVTNRRILICEYGKLSDYPIRPLEDMLISKAKRGASSISIYYKKYPAGQYPKSICELKGIAEEEAQKAYEIMRLAREEALEERKDKMGQIKENG